MENLEKDMHAFFKKMWLGKGFDELSSDILAILLTEPEEVGMDWIAEITGYSLASISNKAKMLNEIGIISKKSKPGTKKIYLYIEKDFFKLFKEAMTKAEEALRYSNKEAKTIIEEYKRKTKTKKETNQITNLVSFLEYMSKVEPILMELKKKLEAIK